MFDVLEGKEEKVLGQRTQAARGGPPNAIWNRGHDLECKEVLALNAEEEPSFILEFPSQKTLKWQG